MCCCPLFYYHNYRNLCCADITVYYACVMCKVTEERQKVWEDKQKHWKNRFVLIHIQLRGNQNLPTILCFGQGLVAMVTSNLTASTVQEYFSRRRLCFTYLFFTFCNLLPVRSVFTFTPLLVWIAVNQCFNYPSLNLSILTPPTPTL